MIRSHFDVQAWLGDHDPIAVIGRADPVVDAVGFDPADVYVETYWLPILGPSATWALRRLTGWLAGSPDGFRLPHDPFARELGLGGRTSRHGPALRALGRLVLFDMAVVTPGDELAVRTRIPPLARRHVCRLPGHLVERHQVDHAGGVSLEQGVVTEQVGNRACPVPVPAGGAAVGSGKPVRRPPEPLHPGGQVHHADRNLSIPAPEPLHTGTVAVTRGAR